MRKTADVGETRPGGGRGTHSSSSRRTPRASCVMDRVPPADDPRAPFPRPVLPHDAAHGRLARAFRAQRPRHADVGEDHDAAVARLVHHRRALALDVVPLHDRRRPEVAPRRHGHSQGATRGGAAPRRQPALVNVALPHDCVVHGAAAREESLVVEGVDARRVGEGPVPPPLRVPRQRPEPQGRARLVVQEPVHADGDGRPPVHDEQHGRRAQPAQGLPHDATPRRARRQPTAPVRDAQAPRRAPEEEVGGEHVLAGVRLVAGAHVHDLVVAQHQAEPPPVLWRLAVQVAKEREQRLLGPGDGAPPHRLVAAALVVERVSQEDHAGGPPAPSNRAGVYAHVRVRDPRATVAGVAGRGASEEVRVAGDQPRVRQAVDEPEQVSVRSPTNTILSCSEASTGIPPRISSC